MREWPLGGKVALVTGGSRGIGRAVCENLGYLGAKVIINYVSRLEEAEFTAKSIRSFSGRAEVLQFDVSDAEAVKVALDQVFHEDGQIDILVNNAGITQDGLLMRMKDSSWDAVIDTNLKGAFNCIRAVSPKMMKKRWGRIINISSVVGFSGHAGQINYSSAKAGLIGMTKSAALELASRGITVNAVAPGFIETDMTAGLSPELTADIMKKIPMDRMGKSEDVATAVSFLVSEAASYITGQCLHVNGGLYM